MTNPDPENERHEIRGGFGHNLRSPAPGRTSPTAPAGGSFHPSENLRRVRQALADFAAEHSASRYGQRGWQLGGSTSAKVAERAGIPESSARYALEALEAVGRVERNPWRGTTYWRGAS